MSVGPWFSTCGLITDEVPKILSGGDVKSFSFQLHIDARTEFLQSSTKSTYHKKLNAEAAVRKQLSSIKSDTEDICKNVKQGIP